MNIILWVIQIVLALFNLAGGGWKVMNPAEAERRRYGLSGGMWRVLGVIEVLGASLLVVPMALNWMPSLTPLAAVVLLLEALFLVVLYGRKSLKIVAANPLPYALVQAVLAAIVAYGRYALAA